MQLKNVECLDLSFEGLGVVKSQEHGVIFVENLLVGEIADIKIVSQTKKMIRAKVTKLIKTSEYRTNNYASFQDLAHLEYKEQIKFKNSISQKMFKNYQVRELVVPKKTINYRNKTTMAINYDQEQKRYFFNYLDKKTNKMLTNQTANLVDKQEHLDLLAKIAQEMSYIGELEQIMVRSNEEQAMLVKITKANNQDLVNGFEEVVNQIIRQSPKIINFIIVNQNQTVVFKLNNNNLVESIVNADFFVGFDQFMQVNYQTMEKIYKRAIDLLDPKNKLIDAYCGIGTIGIIAAKQNKINFAGLEISQQSTKLANKNAKLNNLTKFQFRTGDVEHNIQKLVNFESFKAIVLDPPRAGISSKMVHKLCDSKLDQIIYISCNGITLLRDLKKLETNYEVKFIEPFEMFPQTHHIEFLAYLHRKKTQ